MKQDHDKSAPPILRQPVNVTVKDVPASRQGGLVARFVKSILASVIETQTGYRVHRVTVHSDGSASALLSDERVPGWGVVTAEQLAASPPRADSGVDPCKWVARIPRSSGSSAAEQAMGVQFKSARETLMQAYGASPETIRSVVDPFDSAPRPDWYEAVKLSAVRYKDKYGTVRAKHLLAVGAGVQALQNLRYIADGPKRAAAFISLLEADLLIREATGRGLDVRAMVPEDGDDDI